MSTFKKNKYQKKNKQTSFSKKFFNKKNQQLKRRQEKHEIIKKH